VIKTILVDLDETLIHNAYSYYIPQLDAAKLICLDLMWNAPSPAAIIHRATEIQIEQIKQQKKISKENFPLSYVMAYHEFCEKANRAPNNNISSAIVMAAQKYFLEHYSLFPNVKETLSRIKQTKIIVTRGDHDIQLYKIENTNLTPYFEHIEIVDVKNIETYENILKKYNLNPSECAMVGDSVSNDIKPSLAVGMIAFHLVANRDDWETFYLNEDELNLGSNYIPLQKFEELLVHLD
jgi:FMN phosphatase YigB (HAD superfamily)